MGSSIRSVRSPAVRTCSRSLQRVARAPSLLSQRCRCFQFASSPATSQAATTDSRVAGAEDRLYEDDEKRGRAATAAFADAAAQTPKRSAGRGGPINGMAGAVNGINHAPGRGDSAGRSLETDRSRTSSHGSANGTPSRWSDPSRANSMRMQRGMEGPNLSGGRGKRVWQRHMRPTDTQSPLDEHFARKADGGRGLGRGLGRGRGDGAHQMSMYPLFGAPSSDAKPAAVPSPARAASSLFFYFFIFPCIWRRPPTPHPRTGSFITSPLIFPGKQPS